MQNTDKTTTTASAPETRELKRMTADELASLPPMYGTTADGRTHYLTPSERRDKRTIPAGKPTASEGRKSSDAYDEENLKAHADKLAEMVRTLRQSIRHAHNCKAPQAFPCSCDADTLWNESAEALAAYESEVQP